MALSQCDTSFTWKASRSPSLFISVRVADVNSDDTVEDNESYELQRESLLNLVQDEEDVESNNRCVLSLVCSNHASSLMHGITVISESRTLEISNDTDGYISTVRGKQISDDPASSDSILYLCKCHFAESYTNLHIKFLSLGERTSFNLHSVVVSIAQQTENKTLHTGGSFDINKLKKDVDAMGSAVPDRAKDLLATMEQFKQNKLKNFEDMMACQQQINGQPFSSLGQGYASIMSSMLQTGALKSLFGGSNTGRTDCNNEGPDMYSMLQAVCSSVTSMRTAESSIETDSFSATASPDSGLDSTTHDIDDEKHNLQMDELIIFVEKKIDHVKTELQAEIIELKRDITNQISTATAEMNDKFEKIMCILREVQGKKEESPPKNKTYQDYL